MSFASDLLDGWDILNKKTHGGLKSCGDQADTLNKLASMEREFGKNLVKWAQDKGKAIGKMSRFEKETGSTQKSWEVILQQIELLGQSHISTADKIDNEIVKEIRGHVKSSEKQRKQLELESKKLHEDWKKTKETLDKTRSKYVTLSKEAEQAESHHSTAKSDPNMKPSALTKLSTKASSAAEKAQQADNQYKSTLSTTNDKQREYYTSTMPTLLNKYQTFEETRLNFMKQKLTRLGALNSELPPVSQSSAKRIQEVTEEISVETDIRAFITENNTGVAVPDDIPYVNYDSEVPAPTSSGAKPTASKSKSFSANTASTTGWGKKTDVLASRPSWGLSVNDANLPKDKQEENLRQQMEELDKAINSEKKGLEGLEILVRSYANDPVAQKKTEQQVKECRDALQKLEETKFKVETDLNTVLGNAAPVSNMNQGGLEESYGEEDYAEGEPAVGLFDYTATCDTELSFKEGEPLTITQKDDSGWWYAQTGDGRVGFVPNNYVKLSN